MRRARALIVTLAASVVVLAPDVARAGSDGDDFFESRPGALPPAPAPRPVQARVDAPPPLGLGERGQVVVGGGSQVGLQTQQFDGSGTQTSSLSFSPAVDYFVLRRVSIGLEVNLTYSRTTASTLNQSWSLAGGPRMGVDLPLWKNASFWPRLTFAFESVHRDEQAVPGQSSGPLPKPSTLGGENLTLRLPLVLEPAPRFLVELGPAIFHEFGPAQGSPGLGGQRTAVNGMVVIAGYFGGPPAPALPSGAAAPADTPRFGRAGQVVFTNESTADANYAAYAGSGETLLSLSATLAVDAFVADFVSFGFMVSGGYSRDVSASPAGSPNVDVGDSFSLGPRIGVDIPLGRWFSLYPHGALTFGPGESTSSGGGGTSQSTNVIATASASMPILFHPATHFFLGFGPAVARDLARSVTSASGTGGNDATTLGAQMSVGVWL